MIRLNVPRLMRTRSVTHPHSHLVNSGLSRQQASTLLKPTPVLIAISMIYWLCVKFKCMPNDLFSFDGPEDHHLAALNKPIAPPLAEQTNDLTQEEVEVLQRVMSTAIEEIKRNRGK